MQTTWSLKCTILLLALASSCVFFAVASSRLNVVKDVLEREAMEEDLTRAPPLRSQKIEVAGSKPPTCHNKCRWCSPCEAIQVPTNSIDLHDTNYEPQSWKCKCRDNIFNP
ncbi:hypothetical protein SUGI_0954350 [Cryptomeria japonica]|nr:hypothetical protein SUGI_0954350 [Cryptomeria japonica]